MWGIVAAVVLGGLASIISTIVVFQINSLYPIYSLSDIDLYPTLVGFSTLLYVVAVGVTLIGVVCLAKAEAPNDVEPWKRRT